MARNVSAEAPLSDTSSPLLGRIVPVALGLAAAIFVCVMLARRGGKRHEVLHAGEASRVPTAGVEVWEEKRLPRSFFGQLVVLAFVGFNGLMLYDLANFYSRVDTVRGQYRDNGFAQIGISIAANSQLDQILIVWAIGAIVLGLAVMGTRGRKQMVRIVS